MKRRNRSNRSKKRNRNRNRKERKQNRSGHTKMRNCMEAISRILLPTQRKIRKAQRSDAFPKATVTMSLNGTENHLVLLLALNQMGFHFLMNIQCANIFQ